MTQFTSQRQLNIYRICRNATKENPATREYLCRFTGLTDRQVRREIESLRKEGIRICSSTGYWIAKTDEEYRDFAKNYGSHAWEIIRTLNKMDNATPGQIGM